MAREDNTVSNRILKGGYRYEQNKSTLYSDDEGAVLEK